MLPDMNEALNYDDETVDRVFAALLVANTTLERLICDLAEFGIVVPPDKRHVVVRWLDMFSTNSPISLKNRLAMLKGWLSV